MFRHRHRLGKDIDIFVPDPQYLGFVTPRLSDTAADYAPSFEHCVVVAGDFLDCL